MMQRDKRGTLRFVLAVLVVVSHTWDLTFAGDNILRDVGIGNVAVMGFFVLSGFIITEALATFYTGRPVAFLANRLARIVPPYWAALAFSIGVHLLLFAQGDVSGNARDDILPATIFDTANLLENVFAIFPRPGVLTFDLTHPFYGFVRFYWAIYIELIFYVVAFFVAAALASRLVRRIVSARVVIGMAVVAALALHGAGEYTVAAQYRVGEYGFAFAPYFIVGVCLYFWVARRDPLALAGAAVAYGFLFVHFTRYVQGKVALGGAWLDHMFDAGHLLATLLILVIPFVIWCLAYQSSGRKTLSFDWKLGNLSYPIYLNHWAVIVAFHSLATGFDFSLQLAAVAASITVSWLLMFAVETPMTPLRDRLRGRPLQEGVR